jgi:hypothetical protein
MTAAHTTLVTNLARAGYFVNLHEQWQQGAGAPERARRELPRGAVVFAVGAFDTYLADVVAEVLIARARGGAAVSATRELMKKVQNTVPGLALELILEDDAQTRMDRLQQAVVVELQNTSWHGASAVAKALGYLDRPVREVWEVLEASGFPGAAQALEEWTDKRHRIVHRGEAVRVQREQARSCIRLVAALSNAIDQQATIALAPQA